RPRPDLPPPTVAVSASAAGTAPGDIFAAPYRGPGQAGPMILDPGGGLIWFKRLPAQKSATNLQVQLYGGMPVLTWWQGVISVHGFGLGEDVITDQTYTTVAHVRAGNGLQAESYELARESTPSSPFDFLHLHSVDLDADGSLLVSARNTWAVYDLDARSGQISWRLGGKRSSFRMAPATRTAWQHDPRELD